MALNPNLQRQHLLIRCAGLTLAMIAGIGGLMMLIGFPLPGGIILGVAGVPALLVLAYEIKLIFEGAGGQRARPAPRPSCRS